MNRVYTVIGAGLLAVLIGLTGCGGGSGGGQSAGIGGTGKIASGTITGFGSIFVNGGEYDIDTAICDVDDEDRTGACQANLRIGMVVTVMSDDFSGTSGTATSVVFDDDVEGPVTNLIDDGNSKRFTVLGTSVAIDAATTRFEGFSFDSIAANDVVEVSGFLDGNDVLQATYIERTGSFVPNVTTVELKGRVSAVSAGGFIVNDVTVNVSGATDLSDVPGGTVTVGMRVEAKGLLAGSGEIDASRVEQEDDVFGENEDDVSIEGLVSDFVDNSNFRVAGQAVDASAAVFEPSSLVLANGFKVEVEGSVVSGILIATEVQAEGGEIEVNASVTGQPSGNIFTLALGSGTLLLTTDAGTEYEDETGSTLTSLADLNDGDYVEVRAFDDGAGSIVATKIRRDSEDDIILQGPVSGYLRDVSVTVLGVTFFVQAGIDATSYEDAADASISGTAFFDALDNNPNHLVKIKDTHVGGNAIGIADEVDLED